jgi:hypothetical protein
MDHEQFKGLLLSVLQTCNEDFARQALLALGHGHCSANAHPHSDKPFSAEQRADMAGDFAEYQRQRADRAENDAEEQRRLTNNAVSHLEEHKARADAYAAWLARHHSHLQETADAVWTLLFQYGEEDRVIPKTDP